MRARIVAGLAATTLTLVVVSETVIYGANLHTVRQAESLLRAVKLLRIGYSSGADVQKILRTFGDAGGRQFAGSCPSCDQSSVVVSSDALNHLGAVVPFGLAPHLRLFGNTWWFAQADFEIQNGRLYSVRYRVHTTPASYPPTSLFLDAVASGSPAFDSSYGVFTRVFKGGRELDAWTSAGSTEQERQRAFDFDLSCLTVFGGCRATCELMPSVWIDFQKEARTEGWTLPTEEASDPYCKKLADQSR